VRLPAALEWWRAVPGGADWLGRLPALVGDLEEQWQLVSGDPLPGGAVSLVLRARRADGEEAVLKIAFPEPESEHEGAALRHWDGCGAVRVLEEDPSRRALLLESCRPGTSLWELEEDDALELAAGVLRRLHRPPPADASFAHLADAASGWAATMAEEWEALGQPVSRSTLDEGLAACHELAVCDSPVLLHQDLHGGNVLRSSRGWLAIDPKPLVGDPAFDTASLLRDRRWLLDGGAGDLRRVRRRLDLLGEALGLDRERMRLWGVAHALAWAVGPEGADPLLLRCAEVLHRA
jgi:streptomycin 6-kinase